MLCQMILDDGEESYSYDWQADRSLAKNILTFIHDKLTERNSSFEDISSIGAYQGPGSFTGLRIALTVLNTIASTNNIPIVGVTGADWQAVALKRLKNGEEDKIVLPIYGSEAHITNPRK